MRTLRLILWFVVGLLLSAASVFAYADDYAATVVYSAAGVTGTYSSAQGACDAYSQQQLGGLPSPYNSSLNKCTYTLGSQTYQGATVSIANTCPYGGSYNGTLCSGAPACNSPEVRNEQGQCAAPPTNCEMFPGSVTTPVEKPSNCSCPAGTQWVGMNGCRKKCDSSQAIGATANAGFDINLPKGASEGCFQGCGVQHKSGGFDLYADGSKSAPATFTGWACSGNGSGTAPTPNNQPQPDSPATPENAKHPPKCGAGEGVITSSSGNVMCLPPGIPNTSKPKVETAKKVETYPDNSTKTTETTKTTDPNTGATHTGTSSTSTGGMAGPAGTTSGTEANGGKDADGDEMGDGDCDPTLQMCGSPSIDGLYEKKDKTFKSVTDKFTADMKATPIGQAMETSLNISVPSSGACPNLAVNIAYLNTTIDLAPYICNATAIQYLETMGTILKIVVGYIALTWVFL